MNTFFNLIHLLKSEKKTVAQTRSTLAGVRDKLPAIISVMFKFPYFIGELEHPGTERGMFQSVCATHYFQAPYTFWALYRLYEKGYYLEAMILYRHLVEAFIQIRYFDKYPEKIAKYLKRKNFKMMFDEFAPGYYAKTYGPVLCEAAHGVLFKDFCRFERKTAKIGRTRMGCEFNAKLATSVINQAIALLFGYLNAYDKVYPKHTVKNSPAFHMRLKDALRWLESAMQNHKKECPKSAILYEHMDKFIY